MIIDTHCHLSYDEYENVEEVISRMGNNIMICSGATAKDNDSALFFSNKYNNIYATIGFHPDEAEKVTDEDLKELEKKLCDRVVGIGEIGLDYYHDTDKTLQKNLFIKQLDLARKHNMPVVIHSREAASDTLEILKCYKDLKIVLHCYSYSLELAKEFIKIGCKFGIGGVLTFKNSKKLCEVVMNLSLDNFVLETDSPYLSPHRGEVNEPLNTFIVAEKLAEIKKMDVSSVLEITTKNACEIYNIKI